MQNNSKKTYYLLIKFGIIVISANKEKTMNNLALRNLTYGVYILSTTDSANKRYTGCVVNSVMQLTSSPITLAVSVNRDNYTNECIKQTKKFAVSILGERSNPQVIGTFGFKSGRDTDKFVNIQYEMREGMKVIADACSYLVCELTEVMEVGTHTVFIGKVIDCDNLTSDNAMTYAYYHKVIKGKTPPKAATYIPENKETDTEISYKCSVCGFVYRGDITKEPDSYTCPICGVSKDKFNKQ